MPKFPEEHVLISRFDTALGAMALASSVKGLLICTLPGEQRDTLGSWLTRFAPHALIDEGRGRNGKLIDAVCAFLAGKRKRGLPQFDLDLRGTQFQVDVWTTLAQVPHGSTIAYGELALRAGYPGASRACGTAAGSNPLPLFVPCHRVIASGGRLGGFGGRLDLKRELLALEGVHVLARSLATLPRAPRA